MVEYNSVLDVQFNDNNIVEPVQLAEVKDFCKIDIDTDDTLLISIITAAREMCEDYTGIGFVEHNVVAVLNNSNGGLYFPYGPLISINSLEDEDGNVLILDTDYKLSGNSFVKLQTPKENNLVLDCQTGYQLLPDRLKLALLNTVYYLYDNRAQSIDHIYDKNVPKVGNIGPISEMILKPLRRVI